MRAMFIGVCKGRLASWAIHVVYGVDCSVLIDAIVDNGDL